MAGDSREEIANYLLNNCFIIGTEDSMRDKYYTVVNHEDEFSALFKPLGYSLVINKGLRVAQLVNNYGTGRVSFRKYESILLLILRLIFVEQREKITTNTEKVYATVEKIVAEYDKLNLPKKCDQKMLDDALVTFKKYNLATNIGKLDSKESKVQIYPSVMMGMPDITISVQYDKINKQLHEYESSQEDEQ